MYIKYFPSKFLMEADRTALASLGIFDSQDSFDLAEYYQYCINHKLHFQLIEGEEGGYVLCNWEPCDKSCELPPIFTTTEVTVPDMKTEKEYKAQKAKTIKRTFSIALLYLPYFMFQEIQEQLEKIEN
jgi:hypothetical protein